MWLILIAAAVLAALILAARLLINPKVEGIYAVLGSGGHTGEMLRIIDGLDDDLRPTHFIVGRGDKMSMDKLASVRMKSKLIFSISRPRNVGQSYLTSIITTLRTVFECLQLFQNNLPKLIICNGPGICLIVAAAALLVAIIDGQRRPKVVYIESFARCRSLSLTGKLMRLFASKFYVQWPSLATENDGALLSKASFIGLLV